MKTKSIGKVLSVILAVCMLVSLFTCLSGLTASAVEGNNMFVVASTRSYPAVGYLSANPVLVAGKSYTFTCKFIAPEAPNAFDFSDDSASLRNMFGFWGANSDDNSNAFWWRMTSHTISYDAETKTVTAKITASDDSSGTAMGPYAKIVIGDRNANFRGWGTFYFADPTFVCDDDPSTDLLADCPIDETHYVANGSAVTLAQHKGMWVSYDDANEPAVPIIVPKGDPFGDGATQGNNMFVVASTRSYPAVGYLSANPVLVAGKSYTFTCKFIAPEAPNAFDFSDDSASLRNMFGFWGANSDDNSNAFWWRMTSHTISYDAETKTVTAKITASDDSNGKALGPYAKIVIGDRNANFRGWGTFYFADPTFVCDDDPSTDLLADCPIDEAHYVANGSAVTLAQHKGMWVSYDDAAEPAVPIIVPKGNPFGDGEVIPGDINGDGFITVVDLVMFKKARVADPTDTALDLDDNGIVSNDDHLYLIDLLLAS